MDSALTTGFRRKVLIVGSTGTGKSSLVARSVGLPFPATHVATLGWDIFPKSVSVSGEKFELALRCTGGRERLRPLIAREYEGVSCVIMVYSCTDESTLRDLRYWHNEVLRGVSGASAVLVANKSDLADDIKVTEAEGQKQAARWGVPFFYISARKSTDAEIEKLFEAAVLDSKDL